MKLTEEHKATFKQYVTPAIRKKIQNKLSEKGIEVSDRYIKYVLSGERTDTRGIIQLAIKEASFVKQSETHTKKRLDKLAS